MRYLPTLAGINLSKLYSLICYYLILLYLFILHGYYIQDKVISLVIKLFRLKICAQLVSCAQFHDIAGTFLATALLLTTGLNCQSGELDKVA